jgi:stage V sporulation protein SpoVS
MREHCHCEPPVSGLIPHTTLNKNFVTASVARQFMQSEVMDCFTAFAMTSLFMESEARQSMSSWIAASLRVSQ